MAVEKVWRRGEDSVKEGAHVTASVGQEAETLILSWSLEIQNANWKFVSFWSNVG